MLQTYTDQLSGFGINYDDLELPTGLVNTPVGSGRAKASEWYANERRAKAKRERHQAKYRIHADQVNGIFWVAFPYKPEINSLLKPMGGRWDGKRRSWTVPMSSWSRLLADVLIPFDFSYDSQDAEMGEEAEAKTKTVEPVKLPSHITWNGEQFVVRFPYNPAILTAIKGLPRQSRRWDPDCEGGKAWTVQPVGAARFATVIDTYGLTITADAAIKLAEFATEQVEAQADSRQVDSDIKIDGLGMTLRPYQRAGVAYAVKHPHTFIADAMGLGKTAQAIAATYHTGRFPALVICPASIKIQWQREITKWLPEATTYIVNGQTPGTLPDAEFYIINYEVLTHWVAELRQQLDIRTVIFDESHYIKNPKALRTMAASIITEDFDDERNVFMLTGTPIENRPFEFIAQLAAMHQLDPVFGGYKKFRSAYCWNQKSGCYDGARDLDNLNELLRGHCYIRRTKDQVLSELPAKQRAYLHVEPEAKALKAYKRAESDLTDWLRDRAKTMAEEEGIEFGLALAKLKKAATSEAQTLVKIASLRQLSALAKIKSVVSWIEDQAEPVVVFAHHRAVVEQVAEAFGAPKIYGGMSTTEKQVALDSFVQGDHNVIVCSIQAAGVGIDGLQRASNVLFIEQAWTPAKLEQAEDRLHRIGQAGSVTAWYAKLDVAIDEYIFDMIKAKQDVVNAATEGGKVDDEAAGVAAIIGRFMEAQLADTPID
jgi:superfamily II DNA or RNA helicase